jgi:hypothetical protein
MLRADMLRAASRLRISELVAGQIALPQGSLPNRVILSATFLFLPKSGMAMIG